MEAVVESPLPDEQGTEISPLKVHAYALDKAITLIFTAINNLPKEYNKKRIAELKMLFDQAHIVYETQSKFTSPLPNFYLLEYGINYYQARVAFLEFIIYEEHLREIYTLNYDLLQNQTIKNLFLTQVDVVAIETAIAKKTNNTQKLELTTNFRKSLEQALITKELLEKVIEGFDKNPKLQKYFVQIIMLYDLAHIYSFQLFNSKDKVTLLEKRISESVLQVNDESMRKLRQGSEYLKAKRFKEAVACFRSTIEIINNNPRLSQSEKKINGTFTQAHLVTGYVLYLKEVALDRAKRQEVDGLLKAIYKEIELTCNILLTDTKLHECLKTSDDEYVKNFKAVTEGFIESANIYLQYLSMKVSINQDMIKRFDKKKTNAAKNIAFDTRNSGLDWLQMLKQFCDFYLNLIEKAEKNLPFPLFKNVNFTKTLIEKVQTIRSITNDIIARDTAEIDNIKAKIKEQADFIKAKESEAQAAFDRLFAQENEQVKAIAKVKDTLQIRKTSIACEQVSEVAANTVASKDEAIKQMMFDALSQLDINQAIESFKPILARVEFAVTDNDYELKLIVEKNYLMLLHLLATKKLVVEDFPFAIASYEKLLPKLKQLRSQFEKLSGKSIELLQSELDSLVEGVIDCLDKAYQGLVAKHEKIQAKLKLMEAEKQAKKIQAGEGWYANKNYSQLSPNAKKAIALQEKLQTLTKSKDTIKRVKAKALALKLVKLQVFELGKENTYLPAKANLAISGNAGNIPKAAKGRHKKRRR